MQAKIIQHKGKPLIAADGRHYLPLAFRSFRPGQDNIQEFYNAGVRVMSLLVSGLQCSLDVPYSTFGETWLGDRRYCFDPIERQIALFRQHAPEAKLMIMIHLDTRDWWLAEHEGAPHSFHYLSQIAGYEPWRQDTAGYLEAVIRYVEERYPELVLGYFLMGGKTTEWFSFRDHGEAHPFKEAAFRQHSGSPSKAIPDRFARDAAELGVFRHPVHQREALDYWRFHHELIADTVLYFADRAKKAMDGRKLLGVFFGYVMELSGHRLLHEGHLCYERLYRSPLIDMYCAPSSYMLRSFGGTGGYMNTVDSLTRAGKLFILEFDHITHQAPRYVEGKPIPGQSSKFSSEPETLAVLRRDFAMAAVKGTGIWWFDMFGGWFRSEGMMQEIARMNELGRQLQEVPVHSAAQVAVLVDAESMLYVDAHSGLNTDLLGKQRDGLGRMGAPYDIMDLKDIADPATDISQYRLFIVLNGFKLSRKVHDRLLQLAMNTSMLWVYAPGIVTENELSVAAVSGLTGFRLRLLEEQEATAAFQLPGGERTVFGFSQPVGPALAVADDSATPLGSYTGSGETAIAYRKINGKVHVFCGTANLPGSLLRYTAQAAGVHIYADTDDPLYINSKLLGIHAQSGGSCRFQLPDPSIRSVRPLFSTGTEMPESLSVVNQCFQVTLPKGSTQLFLLDS
ncbi:MAG: hypothetical protein K0R57_4128 [Paenibacillaceae bacterium]|jgi:hypothetical protein|nr:hypothetical protein [Paenibacillaceae bacterium]